MNNLENKFKTASVGGFVKKEVISYIDSMEQEYRNKLGTLEKIVAAAQASRSELENRLQAFEANRGQELNENDHLKSIIAGFQEQLDMKEQALHSALNEVEQLQSEHRSSDTLEAQLMIATKELEELHTRELELQQRLVDRKAAVNEAAQEEIARLQKELNHQRSLIQKLQQENEELRQELEKRLENGHGGSVSTALLLEMQTQLEQRNRQFISLNEELELMRIKCRDYEETVGALEEVHAKAEQIEAGAREKAIAMVSAAAQESDKLKADLDSWLGEIQESYSKVKQEAEYKVNRAYEELEKTKAAMDKLSASRTNEGDGIKRPSFSVIPGYGDAKNA